MNSIKISKFKAFEEELSVLFGGKSLLLYGENGAGKSSMYESIKIVFFNQKLQSSIIASTPEELEQRTKDFWSKYNNKIHNEDFNIEVNGVDYKLFDTTSYQVFMMSLEELRIGDTLFLDKLLERFCFSIDNINACCYDGFGVIEDQVNIVLGSFNESISIQIDEEDNYAIKFIDKKKNLESKSAIRKYFNEAKINLVIILLLLTFIELFAIETKKRILVLDDFITSLDSSNRTFLIKYILDKFPDSQVIIFTHNISFYNLTMFMVNTIKETSALWSFANLYEINNKHKLYQKSEVEKVETIRSDYNNLASPIPVGDVEAIGNRIRKKFEILLYEFSKLLLIGTVEESNNLIDRIMKDKATYYNAGSNASDLIESLEQILNSDNLYNLKGRLQSKINTYKTINYPNFKKIIKELKLYQKVTMHPMSHGIVGMPTFTTKEIEKSMDLLEKMEKIALNVNVATV